MGKVQKQAIMLANIVSIFFFLGGLYLFFYNKTYVSGKVRGSAFFLSWPTLIGLAAFIYFWKLLMLREFKKIMKAKKVKRTNQGI